MTAPRIQITEQVFLAPLSEGDTMSLYEHAGHPELALYVPETFPSPFTVAEAAKRCRAQSDSTWGIFIDGEACGQAGYGTRGQHCRRTYEIGIWLSPLYQGKGIAKKIMRALIQRIWDTTDALRIESEVYGNNVASIEGTLRLGMRIESIRRDRIVDRFGQVQDEIAFVMLRSEKEEAGYGN